MCLSLLAYVFTDIHILDSPDKLTFSCKRFFFFCLCLVTRLHRTYEGIRINRLIFIHCTRCENRSNRYGQDTRTDQREEFWFQFFLLLLILSTKKKSSLKPPVYWTTFEENRKLTKAVKHAENHGDQTKSCIPKLDSFCLIPAVCLLDLLASILSIFRWEKSNLFKCCQVCILVLWFTVEWNGLSLTLERFCIAQHRFQVASVYIDIGSAPFCDKADRYSTTHNLYSRVANSKGRIMRALTETINQPNTKFRKLSKNVIYICVCVCVS